MTVVKGFTSSMSLFLPSTPSNGSKGKETYNIANRWDPYYIRSTTRYQQGPNPEIPPITEEQTNAMKVLEDTCQRLALHMILEVGDIQFLSNEHVLHARTAYKDFPPPEPRRHLMRLWLSTPEEEGGWALPMPDAKEKKRGGIQVDNVAPRAPLDAE
jgi:hypothetical protein